MNKTQRIAGFFGTITIMVTLLVTVSVFLLNGCSKETAKPTKAEPVKTEPAKSEPATKMEKISEMKVVEAFVMSDSAIVIYVEKDREKIAQYWHEVDPWVARFYGQSLIYRNNQDNEVWIFLELNDDIRKVKVLGTYFECSALENENLCKKAEGKVAYWKSIMKWDERVKRILEEVKNRKPEDELD